MLNTVKRLVRSNDTLHATALAVYMATLFRSRVRKKAGGAGLSCEFGSDWIDLRKGDRVIRSAARHAIYTFDLIENFDFFFDAVEPVATDGVQLVDYSSTRSHRVRGFDLHEIMFPSIAEPVQTTQQYLEFAALGPGSVAIDLGAYAGLTSILFRRECGADGQVIAVEADRANLAAALTNFARYADASGQRIDMLEGAVWSHNDGISFSSEGSMGSSASDIVGTRIKDSGGLVTSFTLETIADKFRLDRVDFIKCDIEGGEAVIFGDDDFFRRFQPRMIVEVHPVNDEMTTGAVEAALGRHGYRTRLVKQDGFDLPLLECWPGE